VSTTANARGDHAKLYARWIRDGLQDWYVFPLELLPNDTAWRDIRVCEQKWIDMLWARVQGLNQINSDAGAPRPVDFGVGRVYGYRNMARRSYACWLAHNRGTLTEGSALQYFARFSTNNIIKLHHYCLVGGPPSTGVEADGVQCWAVSVSFIPVLRGLLQVLANRFNRAPSARQHVICLLFTFPQCCVRSTVFGCFVQ
jgi:hypothetical protein